MSRAIDSSRFVVSLQHCTYASQTLSNYVVPNIMKRDIVFVAAVGGPKACDKAGWPQLASTTMTS